MGHLLVKPLWTGLGAQEGNKEGILCAGNDFSAGLAECVGKMLVTSGIVKLKMAVPDHNPHFLPPGGPCQLFYFAVARV